MFWAFAEVRNASGSITPTNTISPSQAAGSARRCAAVIVRSRGGAHGRLAVLSDPSRDQFDTSRLTAHGALAEHEHPVAQRSELVVITAGAKGRAAVARESGEGGRDPGGSTHVDAAGRLIEEKQRRTRVNALGE